MFKKYLSSKFALNVLTLASGTGISQVIPLLFYPVLSRLFTENDYAIYGLYIGIFEFLAIIIVGRYELTIVLPKSEFVAKNIVFGSIILSILLSTVVLLVVIFLNEEIGMLLNNKDLSPYLFFLPITLFIYALNRILIHWLIRKEAFRSISINKVFHKTSDTLSATAMGMIRFSNGLIIGDLLGRSVLLCLNYRSSLKKDLNRYKIGMISMVAALKRYKKFPIYNSVPALANSLANLLPVFLISVYYNETISGSYNFSKIILAAPLALISTSLSQVLSQKLSERKNNSESVKRLLHSIIVKLSIMAVILVVTLAVGGPVIFKFLFGDKWELAGELSRILVFGYGFQFVLVSLYPVFYIFNAIKISSVWQIFYLLLVSVIFFFNDCNVYSFVKIYVLMVSLAFLIYAGLLYFVIRRYEKSLL